MGVSFRTFDLDSHRKHGSNSNFAYDMVEVNGSKGSACRNYANKKSNLKAIWPAKWKSWNEKSVNGFKNRA